MDVDMHTKAKALEFVKMQGLGNDYIYFDFRTISPKGKREFSELSDIGITEFVKRLSDRHFGIGGDGVVFICDSEVADARMRMFNADGTEGKMCGNAIRCIAAYIYRRGVGKKVITIETEAGIKRLFPNVVCGEIETVTAEMGMPSFEPKDIGINSDREVIDRLLKLTDTESIKVTCLSMGNPHCVVFTHEIDGDISIKAQKIQADPMFTQGVNVEFAMISREGIRLRVYERGSGETLACGTGACATAVAAHVLGLVDASKGVDVIMRGGRLNVEYDGKVVKATGMAEEVFTGEITL